MVPTVTTKLSTFKFGEAEKGGKEYRVKKYKKREKKKHIKRSSYASKTIKMKSS